MNQKCPCPAPLGGYVVDDQVGFLLRRANQRHTAIFAQGMLDIDLTPTQFTALVKTIELGPVSQNLLGRLAAMDPVTIQGVVRRLVGRGLIARTRDPADKRASLLTASPAGRALADRAVGVARAITAATLEPLDPREQRQFLTLLNKLV